MKPRTKYFLIFFCTVITVGHFSCKKYEDGPTLSLKSKKSRLVGKWKNIPANGSVYLIEEEFKEDGGYTEIMTIDSSNIIYWEKKGTWSFNDKKENISTSYTFTILGVTHPDRKKGGHKIQRLTSEELWYFVASGHYHVPDRIDKMVPL